MIEYRNLENLQIETLYKTFVEAFSDYQVKIDLPIEKFRHMLKRRGYAPELSIGAFKGPKLTGFVLNGQRSWNGTPTLYDCGTGVLPEYRKQGITRNGFNEVLSLLRRHHLDQYLLEVIQSNKPAVELYQKQGFRTTRSLACFQIDKKDLPAPTVPPGINFKPNKIEYLDQSKLKSLWDFAPSWQNSIESVTAVSDSFEILVATAGETIAGYGIVEKTSGDIPQLAVHKAYRHQGIATKILYELAKFTASSELVLLNIDSTCESMQQFLHTMGFEHFIDQYEMIF